MTSYRRARIMKENDTNISTFSWIKDFTSFCTKVLSFIWTILSILWYWFERAFLVVFLLALTIGLAWWLSKTPSLYRDWESQDAVLPTITWS